MARSTVLLSRDGMYYHVGKIRESDLEKAVVEHSKDVFGDRTLYFAIKQRVESTTKQRSTDGLLLDLSVPERPRFWLVEVELSTHDMMKDVGPQIKNFLSALKNEETLRKVREVLYEEIRRERSRYELIQNVIGVKEGIHYFLDKLLHDEEARGVLIVIDELVDELEELRTDWFTGQVVETILFKIYRKGDKEIYYFTPYKASKEPPDKGRPSDRYVDWKVAYDRSPALIKELADELIKRVETEFTDIEHGPFLTRSWYKFSLKDVKSKKRAKFLVFWLTKSHLHLRIAVDPRDFEDRRHLAKPYKGFFWSNAPNTQEMELAIASKDELDSALELIKQSYSHAKLAA
ncbi:hypothetical protein KEJ39_04250 [Candidatus Bathyarchaeota archaeon]|nr:hypothetical protein [Candidatus Bathyarchaeota archaeon]